MYRIETSLSPRFTFARGRGAIILSNTARRQITEYLVAADENPAVAGWVALIPFDAVIRNRDARAGGDMRAPERGMVARVGDDGDVLVALDLVNVGPIGVGLSAA